jgi:hypothetical protein
MGVTYFSSDDGIDLYPVSMAFDSKWGAEGDRIVVAFYYNPYSIAENVKRMDITVEKLIPVQTFRSALPSTADTVGTGVFLYDNSQSVAAWASQNYLTAIFSVRYGDAAKHTFGFSEAPELFRNDTLFLTLWHNATEDDKSRTSMSHIALELSDYNGYLAVRDSTVISIKYEAERLNSSTSGSYTCNVIYEKKYN